MGNNKYRHGRENGTHNYTSMHIKWTAYFNKRQRLSDWIKQNTIIYSFKYKYMFNIYTNTLYLFTNICILIYISIYILIIYILIYLYLVY